MAQKNLPHTSPNSGRQAREQGAAYESLFADTDLELDDGTVMKIPPHPDLGMLDDEQMEAYEDLQMELESYDREEDIFVPEQRLLDPATGKETGVVLPPSTQKGALKRPYRKDGVRVRPAHSVRVVMAALGDAEYKRLREGGRSAADVWRIWGSQATELRKRQDSDSFRDGSAVALAPIPEADS